MSRTVILKEITTTTDWSFIGIPLPAGTSITIEDEELVDAMANNNDLREAIIAGDVVVNDGTDDLSPILGLNYLEKDHNNTAGGIKEIEVASGILDGISHTLPGGLSFTPGAKTLDVMEDGVMKTLGPTEDYTEDAGGTSIKFTYDIPDGTNMTYFSKG